MSHVLLALDLGVIRPIVDLFKIHSGLIGRRSQILDGDVGDLNVDFLGRFEQELFNRLCLPVRVDQGVRKLGIEEIERESAYRSRRACTRPASR